MSVAPIRVLVVDDERLARQRLLAPLSGEPDIDIVGECENGLEALAAITAARPELVFLDIQMPDLDGLGVITALAADETPEIIFVTEAVVRERGYGANARAAARDGGDAARLLRLETPPRGLPRDRDREPPRECQSRGRTAAPREACRRCQIE